MSAAMVEALAAGHRLGAGIAVSSHDVGANLRAAADADGVSFHAPQLKPGAHALLTFDGPTAILGALPRTVRDGHANLWVGTSQHMAATVMMSEQRAP
jgi:hypothetical protein